jgi:gamma-glutamyltranspeptidase/glutathione hydrolase
VLIEDNDAGKALAEQMKPFGYTVTPTDLGSKLNAVERVDGKWRGAADPRGPGSAAVDDAPPQG